jgi:PEP-CTERM motif
MRVFGRAVLGFVFFVSAAAGASAAPISVAPSCGSMDPAGVNSCSLFGELNPLSTDPVAGSLESDNQVALFELFFGAATDFSVTASSLTGNFDPAIGLFYAEGSDAWRVVTYGDDVEGQFRAISYDAELGTTSDAKLSLTVEPGLYYLALIQQPNEFKSGLGNVESLLAGFTCDNPTLCSFESGGSGSSFTLRAGDPDGPAPVPEPGTLTLMAGGALAGLIQHRRTRRRSLRE